MNYNSVVTGSSQAAPRKPVVGANAGTYTQIPNAVLIGAAYRRLNPTASKGLVLLWFHVASDDDHYEVWPGSHRLSYLVGAESDDTAARAVEAIVAAGLAYWGAGRRHRDTRGRPLRSLYLLVPGEEHPVNPDSANLGNQKNRRFAEQESNNLNQKTRRFAVSLNKDEPDVLIQENQTTDESGSPRPPAPTSGSPPSGANAKDEPDAGENPQKEPDEEEPEVPAHLARWAEINEGDREDAFRLLGSRYKLNKAALARLEAVRAGREAPSPRMVTELIGAIPCRNANHLGSSE